MPPWIRQLFRRTPVAPVVKSPRARLGVLTLEDRVVPAVTASALDPLFNGTGMQAYNLAASNRDDVGNAVAMQADGKIVVAGYDSFATGSFPNDNDWGVWRYNPNGSLDTSFGSGGYVNVGFSADGGTTLDSRARAVAIQSDGKIVVGGYSTTASKGRDVTVIRLDVNGSLDSTFGTNGIWNRPTRVNGADEVSAIALQPDGKMVLAGYRTFVGPDTDFIVTRLSSTGVIDPTLDTFVTFDLGGGHADTANALAIQSDGMIVVAGTATTTSTGTDIVVARLTSAGALDTTFDGNGKLILRFDPGNFPDVATGVAIQSDGKIVLGGTVRTATSVGTDVGVVRLNTNGTFDTTFDGDGKQTIPYLGDDAANALALQPDGKIVLGGVTNAHVADSDMLLARVNADGTLDSSFNSGTRRYAFDLGGAFTDKLLGLALDPSGRVVAVGSASTASNGTDLAMLRVFGRDIPLVVDTTTDVTDGNLAAGSFTLREAIDLANLNGDADAISFTEGLNGRTITLGGTRLEVRRPVSITGPSTGVTIDANLGSQVFYFDGRTNGTYPASLRNLTITRGQSGVDDEEDFDGADTAAFGAGIVNNQTDLTLSTVTVSNNVGGGEGGGIFNWQGANSKLTITNSLVTGNSTTSGGGGLFNWTSATVTAVNTTFSGNTSAGWGGAIFQTGGAITLTNVTATLNRADSDNNGSGTGGFIHIASGTVTMHNSIIAGNARGPSTPDEIGGALNLASSNNVIAHPGTAGGLTNGTNGNQLGVNPLLGALVDNGGLTRTHALGQNSPALGKASSTVAGYSVYDQRGTARDLGAADIGAYEVQHPLAPVGVPTTNAALFAPKPSATANEAFVKGLYHATLLRAPDAGGQATWLTNLANGMSRDTVANGFVNSTENRRNQVTFFYRYFLSREPDTGGLNGWVTFLQSGADEGEVLTGFILSAEFSGNNNNAQFVNLMYYALLGRAADTAGFNDWVNRLNTGTSRADVVRDFLRSEEGLNRVVRSLFQAYLKREADAGGLNSFRTQLLSGSTFGQVAVSILGGQEFFNNAAANMT